MPAKKIKKHNDTLSAKQSLFVAEYLKDKNATRAARDAGYGTTTKSSQNAGSILLSNTMIAKEITDSLARVNSIAELTAADVLSEIKKLAFVDLSEAYGEDGVLLHPKEMPEALRKSLSSVESEALYRKTSKGKTKKVAIQKIKLTDKVRCLEMLAKHFKLLTDMIETSGKDGQPQIVFMLPKNGREAESDESGQ